MENMLGYYMPFWAAGIAGLLWSWTLKKSWGVKNKREMP
jgi:hypothetical protein